MSRPHTALPAQDAAVVARFLRAVCKSQGDMLAAARYAEVHADAGTAAVCKALVNPLTTGTSPALQSFSNALVACLRPLTLVGRAGGFRAATFNTRLIAGATKATGAFVAEGAPAPATSMAFGAAALLEPRKVVSLIVVTAEVVRMAVAGSDTMLVAEALRGVAEAVDKHFIDPSYGATLAAPGAITHDNTLESGGVTVAAIDDDLRRAVHALTSTGHELASAFWAMTPEVAARLAGMRGTGGSPAFPGVGARGGELLGLPVYPTGACIAGGSPTESFVALVEAGDVWIASDAPTLELATHATVQLDDAPASGAQQLISLWPAGLVGLLARQFVAWAPAHTGAAVAIRSVNY
jgi:HK97 family phage major capsid protein